MSLICFARSKWFFSTLLRRVVRFVYRFETEASWIDNVANSDSSPETNLINLRKSVEKNHVDLATE